MVPLADPFEEAQRILSLARDNNLLLRLIGGVAIGFRCPSIRGANRFYRDMDFVARSGFGRQFESLFKTLGYQTDETFNKLNGADRLVFWDATHNRQIDVLIDRLDMSHTIDLRRRLDCDEHTLPLADLLISKLQIFQISDRDLLDTAVLLVDHKFTDNDDNGINVSYFVGLCAVDWGLYHTCQINLRRLLAMDSLLAPYGIQMPANQITDLLQRMDDAPKTMGWNLRARVGERVKWYKLPEEIR